MWLFGSYIYSKFYWVWTTIVIDIDVFIVVGFCSDCCGPLTNCGPSKFCTLLNLWGGAHFIYYTKDPMDHRMDACTHESIQRTILHVRLTYLSFTPHKMSISKYKIIKHSLLIWLVRLINMSMILMEIFTGEVWFRSSRSRIYQVLGLRKHFNNLSLNCFNERTMIARLTQISS